MAAGVIDPAVNLYSVLPYPVTSIIQVDLLEVFLADRTNALFQDWITRNRDILKFRGFRSRALSAAGAPGVGGSIFVDGLPAIDPVLGDVSIRVSATSWFGLTNLLINKPTPVLPTLLSLCDTLIDPKVPIHVCRLLLPAVLIKSEPSTTVRALRTKRLKHERRQMRPQPVLC